MATADSNLNLLLALWVLTVAVVLVFQWRRRAKGVGLTSAYVLNLSLIHLAGAAVYLSSLPHNYPQEMVVAGFRESLFGLFAFTAGAILLAPALLSVRRHSADDTHHEPQEILPKIYIVVGVISYAALSTFLGDVDTLSALVTVGQQIFLAGFCLLAWKAWREGDKKRVALFGAGALLLPFITVLFQGFISYGASAVLVFAVFMASVAKVARWKTALVFLLGVFVALSVFVSYIRDREEIRTLVWGGKPLPERVERVYGTTVDIEWFDPGNQEHLDALDNRLNQNYLVGAAVRKLSASQQYANGETVVDSVEALVPRALLPDKAVVAGSGDLVTKYTGIEFAEATSVGIGHVLEFYVNFGTSGILLGMFLLGILVGLLDSVAYERLLRNDWQGFVVVFLAGVACLQVGGSLVELTASVGATVVLAMTLNHFLYRFQQRKASLELGKLVIPETARTRGA